MVTFAERLGNMVTSPEAGRCATLRERPMGKLRVIDNPAYKRGTVLKVRAWRMLRAVGAGALRAYVSAWNRAFPMPPFPPGPNEPSPIAKAAALRDPALLSEHIDAISKKEMG